MANPKTLSNNTAGVLFTDRRKFYINPQSVAELQPDVTPFLTFLIAKGARGTNDPDFKMFEHRNKWLDQHFSVNDATPSAWGSAGAPGGTVTVAVDAVTGVSLDEGLIGKTVEILDAAETTYKGVARVDAIDAGASTVTLRAIGNAEASDFAMSALADNDIMYVQGTAYGEGTTAPESSHDDLDVVFNSCQIFKTAVEVTGTLKEAALRGYSNELARLRRERAKEHKIQIERSLLFGTRQGTGHKATTNDEFAKTITDPNGNTVRTTMGLITALRRYGKTSGDDQNVFTIDSSYDYSKFVDDSEKAFRFDNARGVKTAFCGLGALSYWSKMASISGAFSNNSGWSVNLEMSDPIQSKLGFNYRELVTPHGIIRLVPTRILRGPYNGYMVVADQENIDLVRYRPDLYETNIKQDDAYDGIKDQWMSDLGLGLQLMESHSLFKVTA